MASSFRITKWRGKELEKLAQTEMEKRLARAAIFLSGEIKQDLSTKGVKCGTEEGERSSEGEAPNLECGQLRNSITYEVEKTIALVGTNLAHGKFLELGTRKMGARPFLRPALAKNHKKIADILAGRKLPGA